MYTLIMAALIALTSYAELPNLQDVEHGQLTPEQMEELGMTPLNEVIEDEREMSQKFLGDLFDDIFDRPGSLVMRDTGLAKIVVIVNKGVRSSRNPNGQMAFVYRNGRLLSQHDVSTGTEEPKEDSHGNTYIATTPVGYFRPKRAYETYESYTFLNAPMPYAVFFRGGIALHGTVESNYWRLGQRASGGCVRFRTDEMAYINDVIISTGEPHRNQKNESFTAGGRYIERTLYTNRERRNDVSRSNGSPIRNRIWTYDNVIIVKSGM